MKRLLIAPLLLTLLFGCSSKDDGIINLKCGAKYISVDDGPYKSFPKGIKPIYLITIDTKKKEGVHNEEPLSGMKVLVDFPTNNLNITKDKIVFDNSSIEDASYGKTEFSLTYSINRINGEVIRVAKINNLNKDESIKSTRKFTQVGTCYSIDDVETLF